MSAEMNSVIPVVRGPGPLPAPGRRLPAPGRRPAAPAPGPLRRPPARPAG